MGSIIRRCTRKDGEKYNILCSPTHEAYETNLCKTGHNFYALQGFKDCKNWVKEYRTLPRNYTLLDGNKGVNQIAADIDFDFVLSQNKFSQFPVLYSLAKNLHLPIISLEHCLPVCPEVQIQQLKNFKGDINLFISEFSRGKWLWNEDESGVIHHGIDDNLFKPNPRVSREKVILTVANDFINRGPLLGFNIFQNVTKNLPVKIVGNTKGLSEPAKSTSELVKAYQSSLIYFNTSLVSPIPTSLLESMACGCAVVTTATCMIPEIIKDGVNGYITNDENEMRARIQYLLDNPEKARELGENARKTILNDFSLLKFVDNWNEIFNRAANMVFME